MKLVRTNNGWSCLAASFATVLKISMGELLAHVGHDGSEVVFPTLGDPERRRSFHPQEMIDVCGCYGFAVTPIEARPTSQPLGAETLYQVPLDTVPRFQRYLEDSVGVLTGLNLRNRPHAVAWCGDYFLDPATGQSHGIHMFQPSTLWVISRMKGQ